MSNGYRQLFFAVDVSNAEVHIGAFADFSQAFGPCEGNILLSPETISSVFGAVGGFACAGGWFALSPGLLRQAIFPSKRRPNFHPASFNCVTAPSQQDLVFCK